MIFSYNWLKDYLKKIPKPEKLAEILAMRSFEVEEIRKAGKDYALDIDVLPNRGPDCFSHIGVAREIAVAAGLRFQMPEIKLKEEKKLKAKDFISLDVEDKNDCLRYTARVVADVKVGPSSKRIQERLKICGLRPINNIVDIANYVMLETGQPLHAFDFSKIEGNSGQRKIFVRRARKGEKIITLDNENYSLDKDILIIADSKGPLAIAGIKGGKRAEIDGKTKTIVLESANFNYRVVRRGSKKIGLKTDASWRFEHRIDTDLTETAINRAASLIQKEAKGKTAYGLADFYPKRPSVKNIKLDLKYVEKLLGIKIPAAEIKKILKNLGFKVTEAGSLQIEVEAPRHRLDISLAEDIVEEIGRIYGYQKVPAVFPIASLVPPKKNLDIFWEDKIKDILKESGFSEAYNYSFIGGKEKEIFKYKDGEIIEVENPTTREFQYLRPSLIPNLLKNVKDNFRYYGRIQLFELGKIFRKGKPVEEKRMLAGLISGDSFYRLKGVVDLLLNKLGISDIWYDSYKPTPEESNLTVWQVSRCAEIKIGNEEIGFLGEISPKILEALKVKEKVVFFDIDFDKLSKVCSEEQQYQPISPFPAAVRDIAVLVPGEVRVEEVLNKINAFGGSLIRDIDLFDIYEGEELPDGKKNLAFHIVYQAQDRTLKAKEIDRLQNKIIKTLEKNPQWEVRK